MRMPFFLKSVPPSGVSSPKISRISVVFPSPFPPTTPARSPSFSVKQSPSKRGSPAYPKFKFSAVINIYYRRFLHKLCLQ